MEKKMTPSENDILNIRALFFVKDLSKIEVFELKKTLLSYFLLCDFFFKEQLHFFIGDQNVLLFSFENFKNRFEPDFALAKLKSLPAGNSDIFYKIEDSLWSLWAEYQTENPAPLVFKLKKQKNKFEQMDDLFFQLNSLLNSESSSSKTLLEAKNTLEKIEKHCIQFFFLLMEVFYFRYQYEKLVLNSLTYPFFNSNVIECQFSLDIEFALSLREFKNAIFEFERLQNLLKTKS